jgi:hypothetical protein
LVSDTDSFEVPMPPGNSTAAPGPNSHMHASLAAALERAFQRL